jgi:hypothetical protein
MSGFGSIFESLFFFSFSATDDDENQYWTMLGKKLSFNSFNITNESRNSIKWDILDKMLDSSRRKGKTHLIGQLSGECVMNGCSLYIHGMVFHSKILPMAYFPFFYALAWFYWLSLFCMIILLRQTDFGNLCGRLKVFRNIEKRNFLYSTHEGNVNTNAEKFCFSEIP